MRLKWLAICAATLVGAAYLPGAADAGGARPNRSRPQWKTVLTVPAVRAPTGIAIDRRGNPKQAKWAYTADAYSQRIVKFSTSGKRLASWPYGSLKNRGTPGGVAVGGSGNVFVADPATGRVSKFSPDGKLLARWAGFHAPRAVAVDPAGNVYVAEYGEHRVDKLSPKGSLLTRWDTYTIWGGGSVGSPTGVAIGPQDYIYTSTTCYVRVNCGPGLNTFHSDMVDSLMEFRRLPPRSGYVLELWFGLGHTAAGQPQQPPSKESEPFVAINSLASDRQGNAYVASLLWPLGGKPAVGVQAYSWIGYKWGRWSLPKQSRVPGLAIDGRGTIYASQGDRILKLTP